MNVWQLIAYTGILHKNRQFKYNKAIAFSYGIITDSRLWQFIRVDNTGKVLASRIIDWTGNYKEGSNIDSMILVF